MGKTSVGKIDLQTLRTIKKLRDNLRIFLLPNLDGHLTDFRKVLDCSVRPIVGAAEKQTGKTDIKDPSMSIG
jgi:hypothetical protein